MKSLRRRVVRATRWLGLVLNFVLAAALLILPSLVVPFGQASLNTTASSLRTLSASFDRVGAVLGASSRALQSTSEGLLQTTRSIDQSLIVIDSAASVVGDLEEVVIVESIGALRSVESAAGEVDRVRRVLAFLRLVEEPSSGGASLEASIGELIAVLEGWPEEFGVLSGSLDEISLDVGEISTSLDEVRADLRVFQGEVDALTDQIEMISSDLEGTSASLEAWARRLPLLTWIFVAALELLRLVNIVSNLSEVLEWDTENR